MMNKFFINSFILGIISFINVCYAKTIEDPVAKHDAAQCATYLCKSLPSYATEYIQSGCVGKFYDYIQTNFKSVEQINLPVENLIQVQNQSNIQTDLNRLMALSVLSFGSALILGYLLSVYEKKNIKIFTLIQNKEF